MEIWLLQMALENKDVFTTIITLWVVLYFTTNSNKNIHNITDEIKQWFKEVASHVWTTKLTDSQIVDIARNKVWFASEAKLSFIKQRLEKNNLKERSEIVKQHIRAELESRSNEYVTYLNQYSTKIGKVWDFIANSFPMDKFLDEVYDIVFRKPIQWRTERECIERKIWDVRFIMLSYQNNLFENMRKDLNK